MSIETTVWAFEAYAGGARNKAVLLCLADCAAMQGAVTMDRGRLAQRSNTTEEQLAEALMSLEGGGLIRIVPRESRATVTAVLIGYLDQKYGGVLPAEALEDLTDFCGPAIIDLLKG